MKKAIVLLAALPVSAFAATTADVDISLTLTSSCDIVANVNATTGSSNRLDFGKHQVGGAVPALGTNHGSTTTSTPGATNGPIAGKGGIVVRCGNSGGWNLKAGPGQNYGLSTASTAHRSMKNTATPNYVAYELKCSAVDLIATAKAVAPDAVDSLIDLLPPLPGLQACENNDWDNTNFFNYPAALAQVTSAVPTLEVPVPLTGFIQSSETFNHPPGEYDDVVTFTLEGL